MQRPTLRLRRSNRGVAPVISTILVVAITVVLAAVLFVMVSSMLTPPPPPPVAVVFRSMGWVDGNNTAEIESATGTELISALAVEYIIRDTEDQVVFTGKAGQTVSSSELSILVDYEDIDAGDRITHGDRIRVIVDPPSQYALVDGGIFEMYFDGKQIASHALS